MVKLPLSLSLAILILGFCKPASAIDIVLDFTLDEQNYNFFDPTTADGAARRASLLSAAEFLSTIIQNDDWSALPNLNQSTRFLDLSEEFIVGLDGSTIRGTAETDGEGYTHIVPISNRNSVEANQYVVYIGAFFFDSGTSSIAIGGWDGSNHRNIAGSNETEFNTWGGRIWFNLNRNWYSGSNPGVNPTNNYGIQDPNKTPNGDISEDNWDWHVNLREWKGFQLSSIDPTAQGRISDLYGVALHELLHALGLTSSIIRNRLTDGSSNQAVSPHLIAENGGPLFFDSAGGHFENGLQSTVWDSNGIISEATLDPNTTLGARKYLTRIDIAALKDIGYEVANSWAETNYDYSQTITLANSRAHLSWPSTGSSTYIVEWSPDMIQWNPLEIGTSTFWTDPSPLQTRRFYRVDD